MERVSHARSMALVAALACMDAPKSGKDGVKRAACKNADAKKRAARKVSRASRKRNAKS
jgi:hypothetical protein